MAWRDATTHREQIGSGSHRHSNTGAQVVLLRLVLPVAATLTLSASEVEGQVAMAGLEMVTFEQLRANRYDYDGGRVALRGYCRSDIGHGWTAEDSTSFENPEAKVRLDQPGLPISCPDSLSWAVGRFTAEQEYLGRIDLEQPLVERIGGYDGPQQRPPASSIAFAAGGSTASSGGGLQPTSCPSPMVIDTVALAAENAPVLRFVQAERDYPTIPFHTAFDSLDSDGDGLLGFFDPDEVAPVPDSGDPTSASWTKLKDNYDTTFQTLRNGQRPGTHLYPPTPAVFYRVRELDAQDVWELWRFLRTDDQAWKRHRMDDFWDRWSAGCQAMASIEYYFYYLDDWGLEGHEEDIEFEFVFVTLHPRDPQTDLRVAVGAGHGSRAPNNTLVFLNDDDNRANHVLVELGGHASAPDARPRPEFAKFIDANWHTTDIWGTRDVLALAGTGFIGNYSSDMTLPRTDGLALQARTTGRDIGYSLLPVSRFAALDTAIATPGSEDEILDHLREIKRSVPSLQLPGTLSPEVLSRLALWRRPLCCGDHSDELEAKKHRIWEHDHFRARPTAILMTHLYRPTNTALRNTGEKFDLWTWSLGWVPGDLGGVSVGFVVPVFFQDKIPVRIRGFLTLEAGYVKAYQGDLTSDGWSARLTYDWSYSRHISWYLASQFTSARWNEKDEEFDNTVALAGGASLLLMTAQDRHWLKPIRAFRIRVGPRLRMGNWDNLLDDVGVDLQVVLR